MMNSVTDKHRALITIKVEVHNVLSTGEFSGQIVNLNGHKEYGVKGVQFIQIEGYDLDNCLRKVKTAIEGIKNVTL